MAGTQYHFSGVLSGHSKDVRCLASLPDPLSPESPAIVSGSRDCSVRLWSTAESQDSVWSETRTFSGHNKYVSCVSIQLPNENFQQGLIYTGSNDGYIRIYNPASSNALFEFQSHSDAVSCIFVSQKTGTLLSCSWDMTAKVWVEQLKPVMTLQGHEAAVWAAVILPQNGLMVTGGADKQIIVWQAGSIKTKLTSAHSQAVRDIAVVGVNSFVSASNDSTLKIWQVVLDGANCKVNCQRTIEAPHNNFLYSMCVMPDEEDVWAATGENSGIMLFKNGQNYQTLQIPAISVWKVTALSNGDLAAGASDGKIWLFSKDPKRKASDDLLALYESELSKLQRPAATELQGIKTSDLPGPSALLAPGNRDGQTKMVKDGPLISVHSWSEADQKWTKIGDVVGQPEQNSTGGAAANGGKVTYEGKEYDYVFDIDVEDGVVLKLPYNLTTDAWQAAQSFIHKHNLPQAYLETIANFIMKNSDQSRSTASGAGGAYDPFTGSGAYTTADSAGSNGPAMGGGGGMDPLTGVGAYHSNGGDAMEVDAVNNHFPQTQYLSFSLTPKFEALNKKLKEFNGQVEPSLRLKETDLDRLHYLCMSDQKCTGDDVSLLLRSLCWPPNFTFPSLDILRLAVLNANVSDLLFADKEVLSQLYSRLLSGMTPDSPDNSQMLAVRTMANLFNNTHGETFLLIQRDGLLTRLVALLPKDNKNVQIAMATLMLNVSVAAVKVKGHVDQEEAQVQCVTTIGMLFLESVTDSEARYRVLVALGTLLLASQENVKLAREIGTKNLVLAWKEDSGATAKIRECAGFVANLL